MNFTNVSIGWFSGNVWFFLETHREGEKGGWERGRERKTKSQRLRIFSLLLLSFVHVHVQRYLLNNGGRARKHKRWIARSVDWQKRKIPSFLAEFRAYFWLSAQAIQVGCMQGNSTIYCTITSAPKSVVCLFVWGFFESHFRFIPGFVLRNSSWQCLWNHMGCRELLYAVLQVAVCKAKTPYHCTIVPVPSLWKIYFSKFWLTEKANIEIFKV